MKKLLGLIVLWALAGQAWATPYFRPIDLTNPQPVAGALLDPAGLSQSSGGSLLPLITHSPKDGCLLPTVVCESWSPLAVGGSMNAGKITLNVGPIINVLPSMQGGLKQIVPASWTWATALLTPSTGQPVTFSAGPIWEYDQLANKGYFRVFTGVALNF